MLRHILYLAGLLKREAINSDWNVDEGCEGDEDEDDHGTDEEYINEYDRVETKNHTNENDEHCDTNDSEHESSLESGFWLRLSEAIFQLSMMLWTYQEPTGDMSASTIIHNTAAQVSR
jgi:ABC-type Zn2+ transport system substrate-binding protein/surface adhesin